ncbi:ABC transporter substrate-binding protein [Limobrevibacterium gyesilva]|uniref:ABC transporter substrate-binding protein n=1 Tax=Limobrevibacterium gyesilva TaxID=2991712 RepID=A0AA41YRH4_9PROT|nr:ABC transporter substrate-binding protein [Limobrevibacterium gyesilva]MCW3477217.1 ABC transporter substrate-binding protein [Limobrevibacterium gyesilva]
MTQATQPALGRRLLLQASAGLLALPASRAAWAKDATLRIGMAAAPSAMDPHYHVLATNQSVLSHIFETLVRQDAAQKLIPGLAASWRLVGDTTWEFQLREGVAFHDGSPFTAADVVFSLGRVPKVPNSPSSFAIFLKQIATTEVVTPHVIRFHTHAPYPDLPIDLSQIAILSETAAAGPVPEGKTTQQLNAGDGTIGTGPYRFVSFTPNDRVVLAPNPSYWGDRQPWSAVTIMAISSSASRVAALLAGDVDLIEKVPGEDALKLRGNPALRVMVTPSNSVFYLCFDQARDDSPGVTDANGRNPLRDPRVRKALSIAIDRERLTERILSGLGQPAAELAAPGMFGATPDAQVDKFDPEAARKLLSEAGYPNGFGLTLATTNGFYVQDAQLAQSIAAFWTRVGVRTKVEALPSTVFYTRRNARGFSAYFTSMSIITGQASDTLKLLAATQDPKRGLGQTNFGGYSNPRVDALIDEAARTMDPRLREQALQQASRIVTVDDHGILAIAIEKIGYACRNAIEYSPRVDKWVTAMQTRPAAAG